MSSSHIGAVLFDADGVLQHAGEDYRAALAASQGWTDDRVATFLNDVFAVERPLLAVEADLVPLLQPVVEAHGLDLTTEEFLDDWCRRGIAPDSSALELVRRLRLAGTVCGLATNQVSYRATYMLEDLGYADLFDHLFVSCRMGWAKPSSEYFGAALEALGLEPQRVLFIDDHTPNVDAAREAGMQAALFVPGEDLASRLADFGVDLG